MTIVEPIGSRWNVLPLVADHFGADVFIDPTFLQQNRLILQGKRRLQFKNFDESETNAGLSSIELNQMQRRRPAGAREKLVRGRRAE